MVIIQNRRTLRFSVLDTYHPYNSTKGPMKCSSFTTFLGVNSCGILNIKRYIWKIYITHGNTHKESIIDFRYICLDCRQKYMFGLLQLTNIVRKKDITSYKCNMDQLLVCFQTCLKVCALHNKQNLGYRIY